MGLPLSGRAYVGYERKDVNVAYDADVFPKETNKITKIGRLKIKKYLVKCDGNGHMSFDLIQSQVKHIEELAKLRERGILTNEEFQKEKKKLLGNDGAET